MRQFFKFLLASILGVILATFLLFFIAFGFIAMTSKAFKSDKAAEVKPNSVLHVDLNYGITERTPENPFAAFDFASFEGKKKLGLTEIITTIQAAKDDDDIKGMYFDLSDVPAGFATIKAVRDAIEDFKGSGKFVVGYGEFITQRAYYLGSTADEVYLNPKGYLDFRGLGAQMTFFKKLLDKLDIEMQVFKTGDYKSAAESFTSEELTEGNEIQIRELLVDFYDEFLTSISDSRSISVSDLQLIADSMSARNPSGAADLNLVDGTKYYDQVEDIMQERLGLEDDEKISFVRLDEYYSNAKAKAKTAGKDKIAVLYASGPIVDGEGDENNIGSKRFAKEIRKLRKNKKIKGLVVRVNSPGGSAMASEVIWRELMLTREEKPVVISMGDVAASGGYYIACAGEKVYAEPNTVTGSIGVIGMVPNMEAFFEGKLGITFDEVETAEHAVFGGGAKPLSATEVRMIQEGIDTIYGVFKGRVADAREMSVDNVDRLAGGRIYSGEDALDLKLVDEMGNLQDAVAEVADMAGLDEYRTVGYPKSKSPLEGFLKSMMAESKTKAIKAELGPYYGLYQAVRELKDMNPVQARLPFYLEIE